MEIPLLLVFTFACVFGACIGSFLNVCIYRLPLEESIVSPESHCRSCSTPLAWYDNIPLLTYLFRRGRCRACGAQFSSRYFFVELLTALITLMLVAQFGISVLTLGYLVFVAALVVITFVDVDYQIIPDVISLPGIAAGICFSFLFPHLTLWDSLIGAAAGAGILLAVALGYWLITKREGMGMGDVKLLAMIGAFLGVDGVFLTIFFSAFLGAAIFGPISLKTGKLVPFGIFLAAGAAVAFGWGDLIVGWCVGWAFGP